MTFAEGNDGVRGHLYSSLPGGESENNGVIEEADMPSAMLLFCSRKRIRLPIRAVEWLEMNGSALMPRVTVPSR